MGVTGTFLGTPSQGVWSTARLDFSAPPGGIAKLHFGAFGGSIPGLVQQSAGTLDLYSMQIRASAFEGDFFFSDGPAGGLAGPHGTGSPRRATWAATAAVQRRELHRRVHHGRGRLGRHFLRCAHGHRHRRRGRAVVHGGRVRQLAEHQRRGQRGPAELRHRNHGRHAHHQQHGQRRELHHGGRLSTGTLTASGAATAASFAATWCGYGRHADNHRGGLHGPAGLREPGLHLHGHERRSVDGQRGVRRRDELGHGLRAAALRLQHAHRDQHLRLLGRSLLGNQSARVFLERDGGAPSASSS